MATPKLFEPLALRSLTLANRVVVSPLCQYSGVEGCVQPWHFAHLGGLVRGGAGLVFVEATAVAPAGRITHGCLGLYDDDCEDAFADLLRYLRSVGPAKIALQIGHAGRKGSSGRPWEGGAQIPAAAGGWATVAPSALPIHAHEESPRAVGAAELELLRQQFIDTVHRAERLGFDAVEVHAAHGYLLHQFLSPVANQRDDEFGGTLENSMRFPLAVIAAARAAWPAHKPLGVRISATDWVQGSGWDVPEATTFSQRCEALGVDWIDVSSGGVSPQQKITLGPGYQVPFARAVKAAVKVPVMTVGLITDGSQAEAILANGDADLIAVGRGMMNDPHWAWRAAAALGTTIDAPRQYWRSQPRETAHLFGDITFGQR